MLMAHFRVTGSVVPMLLHGLGTRLSELPECNHSHVIYWDAIWHDSTFHISTGLINYLYEAMCGPHSPPGLLMHVYSLLP